MTTQTIAHTLCVDGPLRGEFHDRGPRFSFDGALIGAESGTYSLEDGQYRWQAASSDGAELRKGAFKSEGRG
jgi:hypothetical protein